MPTPCSAVDAMSLIDRTDHLFMWDGGNDQHPRPPFNYISTFNIAGLTNEHYGESTGFSAMERTTGWDGAIVAIMNARGVTPRGVKPVEVAVPAMPFVAELRRRGFSIAETLRLL